MPISLMRAFIADDRGAVASTYALALVGLVVAAGVGYDYAQLATLDSELQNAADQAALAAASQLDGKTDAITRAQTAAQTYVTNTSLLANDGGTSTVVVDSAQFAFYKEKAHAENDISPVTNGADAKYVKVKVVSRKARYTLTPIISRIAQSQSITALATAGLGSSICRVPPVMMCNTNPDPSVFNVASYVGKGMLLIAKGSNGAYTAGVFGYLDVGAGANDLGKLLSYANPPGDCVEVSQPTTQPGSVASVINDFNTRFDIYDQGDSNNCYGGSLCPPSDNARKDVVQSGNRTAATSLSRRDCGFTSGGGGQGWKISDDPYRPASAAYCDATNRCSTGALPDAMGLPRDLEHAWPNPNMNDDRVGDGTWDIYTYWKVNHGTDWAGQVPTTVPGRTYPTRYEVYQWERDHPVNARYSATGDVTSFQAPMCRPGLAPAATTPDRRVIPVAVVNCTGLSGAKPVTPIDWIDVFLVEPSLTRRKSGTTYTSSGEIYVEVIGGTSQGTGGAASQVVRRDKPFLVK